MCDAAMAVARQLLLSRARKLERRVWVDVHRQPPSLSSGLLYHKLLYIKLVVKLIEIKLSLK
jgi:hypothetical protein